MVGIGNSGVDIAVELGRVAKQVCWQSLTSPVASRVFMGIILNVALA